MKFISTIVCLVLVCSASCQSLDQVRKEFHEAVLDPKEIRPFHEFIINIENPSATILAYQAVSEALLAKVAWNPFTKLSQVMKYDKLMEKAVMNDPQNIEIRFLRLAIEYSLPAFLGMNDHLDEDITMIKQNLQSITQIRIDSTYGRYILYFLESTDLCTSDELLVMKKTLDQHATF